MANQDLYGKIIGQVPGDILTSIKNTLTQNNEAVGSERAQNLLSDPNLSYSNAKKIKSFFDNFNPNVDSPITYELYGGKAMHIWLNQTLNVQRSSIHKTKEVKSVVFNNQFKQSHAKDGIVTPKMNYMDNINNQLKRIEESEAYKYLTEELEKELRVPGKAAVCVILNKDNQILITKRSQSAPWEPNKWGLVGGKVDENEKPLETAKRETMEEAGLNIEDYTYAFTKREPGYVVFVYRGRYLGPLNMVKINKENSEYMWANLKDIDKLETVPNLKTDIMAAMFQPR